MSRGGTERVWRLALVVVALLVLGLAAGCAGSTEEAAPAAAPDVPVATEPVTSRRLV